MNESTRLKCVFAGSIVLLVALAGIGAPVAATEPSPEEYVLATTVVVKEGGNRPAFDDNVVPLICNEINPHPSVGGGCIPFDPLKPHVLVTDAVLGTQVAYQVCIDEDADGVCTFSTAPGVGCNDRIFFSHADDGTFYNPIGALPVGFKPGCGGPGGYNGYVVFLCDGVHATAAAHSHVPVAGIITHATSGTGFGDFCGAPAGKEYRVQ